MKVANLIGGELNYWVAMAIGHEQYYPSDSKNPERLNWLKCGNNAAETPKYSTDAAEGMVLIDLFPKFSECRKNSDMWAVKIFLDSDVHGLWPIYGYGKTLLIAAMRAIVARKFGSDVTDILTDE